MPAFETYYIYIDGAQVINFDFAHAYIWNLGEVLIMFQLFYF